MDRTRGGRIAKVEKGSIPWHLGIEPGDTVVSINGHVLRDELDYRFYVSEQDVALTVQCKDGQVRIFEIEKDEDDSLGLVFEDPIFDGVKTCSNNCVFCFLGQVPRNMRQSLHLRDDDYRMSFLYGNFISLTNFTRDDWARLREQRLSPLRVSVHATQPDLRKFLMKNPKAADIMDNLRALAGMGIQIHVQIVLLKGINDGDALKHTLDDLNSLGLNLVSVGVVPAIYTRFRKTNPSPLIDNTWAGEIVDFIEQYAHNVKNERNNNWVYAADEFYVVSGKPFPDYDYYDEFHQFDNGIGMVADFRFQLDETIKRNSVSGSGMGLVQPTIAVTGEMAYKEVLKAVERLGYQRSVSVLSIPNVFFGPSVTCSGLLTGQDILAGLLGFLRGEGQPNRYRKALIPETALFGGVFLDDMTMAHIGDATGLEVETVEPSPVGLVRALQHKEGENRDS